MKESMEALIHHFKVRDSGYNYPHFSLIHEFAKNRSLVRAILFLLEKPTALLKLPREKWQCIWSRGFIPCLSYLNV
jgi:hypothetical protein